MEAARHLRSKVCEYVSHELGLPSHIQIRVRVYANMKGLASTYCHNKILDSTADFDAFVRGFNMGHPMADVQCQAVIFGGSADNGYARLLQPYVGDDSKSARIILIEGPRFVKELARLKEKFPIVCFPDLFRNTKLPSRRVSFSTTPPSTPIPNALSYAATIASPVHAAAVRTDDHPVTIPARKDYPVLQNSKGQRLDAIINPPQSLVRVLRDKKLCNWYHILGECPYPDCAFVHGVRLDEKGIEARRLLARQAPCSSGLQCKDKNCLLGHQCPDKACARIGKGCRFTPEMHSVDRT
ncbi:hypothetical protein F5884DRAFT_769748 [Xylogone sp. PMI_703]|nr:hypothetical protein F5884DRAFT_769748 [Xylogone sp. PMI_703]